MRVGGARPPPLITFTITSKVAVYAPAEWADTLTLFHLYKYVLCGWFFLIYYLFWMYSMLVSGAKLYVGYESNPLPRNGYIL